MSQPKNYTALVVQLKQEIQTARIKASLNANAHLLTLYWKMGAAIASHENAEGWGAKIVEQLATDLRSEFPDMKGISPRNLRYMREFFLAYPQFLQQPAAILQPPVAKSTKKIKEKKVNTDQTILQVPLAKSKSNSILQPPVAKLGKNEIMQQVAAQIPWSHNVVLLDRIKDLDERLFYIRQTAEHGWSRNVLVHQIESGLYKRKGAAITNFDATLPAPQSDLARELLKDPYKFDFLSLGEEYLEEDLEDALVTQITKFLLELGAGFSYVGRQAMFIGVGEDCPLDVENALPIISVI